MQDGAGRASKKDSGSYRKSRLVVPASPVRIDWRRLRQLREEAELSQVQLARRSSISQCYISQIETGDVLSPTVDVARRLARGLGISLGALLTAVGYNVGGRRRPNLSRWATVLSLYRALADEQRRLVLELMRTLAARPADLQEGGEMPALYRFEWRPEDGSAALRRHFEKVKGWH